MSRRTASLVILLIAFISAPACAPLRVVRITSPEPASGPPVINKLVDLGGVPLVPTGTMEARAADGRFTPGEWVAVLGENLHPDAEVKVGGVQVPVEGLLKGGSLLVRIPRAVNPRRRHRLEVKTAAGQASVELVVHRYLMVAEPDGGALRFVAIGPDTDKAMGDDAAEVTVPGVAAVAVSASGAMAYAIVDVTHEEGRGYAAAIQTIHLGGKDGPRAVGRFSIASRSRPRTLAAAGDTELVVLCEKELLFVPAGGGAATPMTPLGPRAGGPEPMFTDLVLVDGGEAVVLLDARGNRLVRIKPGHGPTPPKVTGILKLARDSSLPLTIDLSADPDDPAAVWVLQGPNFRVAGEKLKQALKKIQAKVLSSVYEVEGDDAPTLSRVVRVAAGAAADMKIDRQVLLPDAFYPFMLLAEKGGSLVVSGVGNRVLEFAQLEPSVQALKRALELVVDTPQVGRIIRLSPDRKSSAAIKGVLLYFGLAALPDGTLLYNLLRPGLSLTAPFVAADWGVESADGAYLHLARLGWKNLIPPYRLGVLTLQ